jgi:hypothetical protein
MIVRTPKDDQPRAKKQHRKVKTGCRTCKQVLYFADLHLLELIDPRKRRVKCDEKFPTCDRCVSAGRICDGYGIWGGGGSSPRTTAQLQKLEIMKTLEISALWTSSPRETSALCPGPRISSEERGALEWFVHGTSNISPRIYATPFWPSATISAAMDSPMLLQALLALSSAHKRKVLNLTNRAHRDMLPDSEEIFMIKHYSLALGNMRKHVYVEEKLDRTGLLLAAYCCALFMLTESLCCNYDNIRIHLTAGTRLVNKLRELTSDEFIEAEKLRYFASVQDQLSIFLLQQQSPKTQPAPKPTLRYKSPVDAKEYLEATIEAMEHAARQTRLVSSSAKGMELSRKELAYHTGGLDSWKIAAEATIASRAAQMTSKETLMCRSSTEYQNRSHKNI